MDYFERIETGYPGGVTPVFHVTHISALELNSSVALVEDDAEGDGREGREGVTSIAYGMLDHFSGSPFIVSAPIPRAAIGAAV
jgi:hypothetical protein